MIKVKAQYHINMYEKGTESETVEFDFEDDTPQMDIDEEIRQDFWVWMSNNIEYGWYIKSQERIEDG